MNMERGNKPIVERPVYLKFEGADGVRNALNGIAFAVGVVVHGINAPLVARAVVVLMNDAIHNGVAHVHIGRSEVNFGSEGAAAVGKFALAHAFKQVEILFHATVAIGAGLAGLRGGAAIFGGFFLAQVANISLALFYHLHRPLIELFKIVGGIKFGIPLKTEPFDVFFDGVHIFGVFFGGIRIVEA